MSNGGPMDSFFTPMDGQSTTTAPKKHSINLRGNIIDKQFEQWDRFENFLKFASKKEVRDRLKEFDAPSLSNYIDPDTIDKIHAAKKPPIQNRGKSGIKNGKKRVVDQSAVEENKARILKLRELYGLFVKMDQNQDADIQEADADKNNQDPKSPLSILLND